MQNCLERLEGHEMTGMFGMPLEQLEWLECLECLVGHTDGFLEDFLAFYAWNFFSGTWNEGLFALCM